MAVEEAQPTQSSLRKVLLRVLAERSQLDRLCVDYFGSLVDKFSPHSSLNEAITTLFQYVEPGTILVALQAEPDWAARLEAFKHLLEYPPPAASPDLAISAAAAVQSLAAPSAQPASAPSFPPQAAAPWARPLRPRPAPRRPAPVGSPPSWVKRGLWLLLGATALGGSAGAALSFFHSRAQPIFAKPPTEPPPHTPAAPSPLAQASPATPALAPALAPGGPRLNPPSPPSIAPQAAGKQPSEAHKGQPKSRPKRRPESPQIPAPERAAAPTPTSPPPPCESSACAQTGTYEYYDRLLKEGKTACKANSPLTASQIYRRLAMDPDRQYQLKLACEASKVELN